MRLLKSYKNSYVYFADVYCLLKSQRQQLKTLLYTWLQFQVINGIIKYIRSFISRPPWSLSSKINPNIQKLENLECFKIVLNDHIIFESQSLSLWSLHLFLFHKKSKVDQWFLLLAALDPLTTVLSLPCTCLTCELHKNVEFCLINLCWIEIC